MPDWIGGDGHTTAETYRRMAETQLRGVSATYERLCRAVAARPDVCGLIDRLPLPKRQPNLLLGAVRFLDGPVDDPTRFCAFLLKQWPAVENVMLTHATQTNEPGRCATLLPQLATIAGPVALLEVGASAGWRAGLDLHPLDVTSDADVRWLEALIWPEQTARFATLHDAVAVARAEPPHLVVGDLGRDVRSLATGAPADAMLVIFHSAVLAYVPPVVREAFASAVADLARERSVVWLSNEGAGVVPGTGEVTAPSHSFVLARDGVPVAITGPHGQFYRGIG